MLWLRCQHGWCGWVCVNRMLRHTAMWLVVINKKLLCSINSWASAQVCRGGMRPSLRGLMSHCWNRGRNQEQICVGRCACSRSDVRPLGRSEWPRLCCFCLHALSVFCEGNKNARCFMLRCGMFVFIERLDAASPFSLEFTLSGWSSHRRGQRVKLALSRLRLTNRKVDEPEAVTVPRAQVCTSPHVSDVRLIFGLCACVSAQRLT